jgi:protein-S-isoprenylcysteine O-methyltransferase Ste14
MISNILISNIAKITGLIISFTGLILWISSMIELGSSFGVLPRKQKKTKTGIYRYLNHPMYIGISMTMLGISLANGSLQGLIFTLMILVPILIIRSRMESRILY